MARFPWFCMLVIFAVGLEAGAAPAPPDPVGLWVGMTRTAEGDLRDVYRVV